MQEKNDTDVSFCGRFAALLNNCEYSQRQVAVKLGLTEGAIINYKRDRIPKAWELLRIAKFFGVTMEWLLTGKDPMIQASSDSWRERCKLAEAKLSIVREALQGVLTKTK